MLGIEFEGARAASAKLHAAAVNGHDLFQPVVAQDQLFKPKDQFHRDGIRIPYRQIKDDLRKVIERRTERVLPLRLKRALRLAVAQGLQLVRRLGEYMPLPERQHARQSQAVHPALLPGRVFLLAVRHPHPADQDMPSLVR